MDWPLAKVVAVVVVLLFAVFFGGSILLSPDRGIDTVTEGGGQTVVGVQGSGVGFHEGGRVAMYDGQGNQSWEIPNADSYFDVSALEDGRVLGAYAERYEAGDCEQYDPPCGETGVRLLDPDAEDPIVGEYGFEVRSITNSEVHDAEMLPSGDVVMADMDRERVLVVDLDTDEVRWQWNASDYYEVPDDPTQEDWLHVNDVDRIGEDRYLVSVRNENQLLVVERGEGVVEVINEEGDPDLFRQQHNPHWLEEGAILLADSENDRVIEIHHNETTGEWEHAWMLYSANDIRFNWPRDADRLPDGTTLVTDSTSGRVVEVTQDRETVWSAPMPDNPYEADRLPHGEQTGVPTYDSDAIGEDDGGGEIPVLTPTLRIVQHSINVPHWFGERHVAILLVAIGLGVAGVVNVVRSRVGG